MSQASQTCLIYDNTSVRVFQVSQLSQTGRFCWFLALSPLAFDTGPPNVSVFDMCAWGHVNPMCYMCYMVSKPPHSPGSLLYDYMCYMVSKPPHSAGSLPYVLCVLQLAELCTLHIASQHVPNMHCVAYIVCFTRVLIAYREPGKCWGSVGWRVRAI